jgi:hypothetical protein
MVFGLYFLGAGARAPQMSMFFIVTIIVGTGLTLGAYSQILPVFMPGWSVWLVGGVAYAIGGGLGIGAMRWPTLGVCLMGLILGFGLGEITYYLVSLTSTTSIAYARLICLSSIMLATVAAFICLYDYAVIISCATSGAFAFVRGFSMMIKGSYPNEVMLRLVTNSGQTRLLPWCIWLYWSIMVLLCIVSIAT